MKHLYFFSGLGADEKIFKKLHLPGYEITHVKWISPGDDESIESYAKRLTAQISTSHPILIGLSFGGMMATEVAKLIDTEKIIIIASAKTRSELPFYYRLAGRLGLHKLVPAKFMKTPNRLSDWIFGIENKEDKEMLAAIMHEADKKFLKWAVEKILTWQNKTIHNNLTHIHGTGDRILPIRFVTCDLKVVGAGHFMTLNRPEELSQKILSLL